MFESSATGFSGSAFVTTVIGPAYDQFKALARHQDSPSDGGLYD